MKNIMKILAAVAAVAAAACAIIVFWDNITQGVGAAANKIRCRCSCADGYMVDDEDYTDWDE